MNPTPNQPIQKLSTLHEMLANWILQNPGGTYRQMGAKFNYTVPWLCTVVNSDLFKAYMAARMREVNSHVEQDIPEMLRGTAVLAIERMNDVLANTSDPEVIVDSFDKVLHRYGYAPNAKASPAAQQTNIQQNNVFFLNREDVRELRNTLLDAHKPKEKVLDGEPLPVPT